MYLNDAEEEEDGDDIDVTEEPVSCPENVIVSPEEGVSYLDKPSGRQRSVKEIVEILLDPSTPVLSELPARIKGDQAFVVQDLANAEICDQVQHIFTGVPRRYYTVFVSIDRF